MTLLLHYKLSEYPEFAKSFKHLFFRNTYCVIQDFRDFDTHVHHVGEVMTYLGHNISPYESGLSLYFEIRDVSYQVRLKWEPEAQESIIDDLENYISVWPNSTPGTAIQSVKGEQ